MNNCGCIACVVGAIVLIGGTFTQAGGGPSAPTITSPRAGLHSEDGKAVQLQIPFPPWNVPRAAGLRDELLAVRVNDPARMWTGSNGNQFIVREREGAEVPAVVHGAPPGNMVTVIFLAKAGKEYEIDLARSASTWDDAALNAINE